MEKLTYVVDNPMGVHARPAALLAQLCVGLRSVVTIECNGRVATGNNVLQILALSAKHGDTLDITVEGEDEAAAIKQVEELLRGEFEEKKRVKILKIAFFGTKDYDRTFFDELTKDKGPGTYNSEIDYFNVRLTPETVGLAKGHDAVCIFVNDEAPRVVVEELGRLGVKLILLRCAGFNNVDLQAAKEWNIKVCRVPAYSPYAVAEHAMAIIHAANRRLHRAYMKVKDNNFALSGLLGYDLHNKVAGIVGTGRIGQCMANICKGFGMTVIGWDAFPNKALEEQGLLTYVTFDELLAKSDLISLHAPLFPGSMAEGGTTHMIDKDSIAKMKDEVMLVNTARGPLINAEDLIDALKNGKFHAVGLDVYEGEDENVYTDRSDERLHSSITARLTMFPNVILTSHQAFFTREALQAIATTTMENARNFNEGNDLGFAECKAR